ncbi:hypothetical protein [Aliirhizobium smilacinae]|uniref:Uncharacterized protein n=1 Tax=Aliirhizobium smilacinae TaxID=1395944 RepID=A0A5C4XRV4_9HYPH|nr:hypothetical protein [Rhizobium smilacinae]TNM65324.1 hypothetical protein FHP24_03340 [Rhizobium smilacinae]
MASISMKLATGGGVRNPNFDEMKPRLEQYLRGKGYQIAGSLRFADLNGIAAMKSDCLLYLVPIAHQGWNEATVLQQTQSDQEVYFLYEGTATKAIQPRLSPMLGYYSSKFLSYLGLKHYGYAPMLAAVTTGSCDMNSEAWADAPTVSFPRLSFFDS